MENLSLGMIWAKTGHLKTGTGALISALDMMQYSSLTFSL